MPGARWGLEKGDGSSPPAVPRAAPRLAPPRRALSGAHPRRPPPPTPEGARRSPAAAVAARPRCQRRRGPRTQSRPGRGCFPRRSSPGDKPGPRKERPLGSEPGASTRLPSRSSKEASNPNPDPWPCPAPPRQLNLPPGRPLPHPPQEPRRLRPDPGDVRSARQTLGPHENRSGYLDLAVLWTPAANTHEDRIIRARSPL
ncbi:atherin-like [Sarcophilus harrisii]|uniref:atherin-like n=1 Tax=Sarcophilus harrisii TaxID=9305 RepID=UPI001301CDA7|nr:atherin-like [Sarcophilus harrisii]